MRDIKSINWSLHWIGNIPLKIKNYQIDSTKENLVLCSL